MNDFEIIAEQRRRFEENAAIEQSKYPDLFKTANGISTVCIVPNDAFVIVKGTVMQSTLTLSEKKLDESQLFEFFVAGYGYKIDDLSIGMKIHNAQGQRVRLNIASNERSVEALQKWIRSLKPSEIKEFIEHNKEIEASEYFLVPRYDIAAIEIV